MRRPLSILLLCVALCASCVSTRKFNSLRAELLTAQSRVDKSNKLAEQSEKKAEQYAKQSSDLADRNSGLLNEIAALQRDKAALQSRYDRLLSQGSADAENMIRQLQNNQRDLDVARQELAARSARVAELERLLAARNADLAQIRSQVSDALSGFDGKGLSISSRDGNVYVSMDDKLLFRSASFEVEPAGARAVKDLAAVLAANPDIAITVEGHTDDVPYRGSGHLKDNLDLSAKRATSVTRLLLSSSNIDPKRIVSSARGEWMPVARGKSTEARQQNRRTEIILTPRLDELMQLMNRK